MANRSLAAALKAYKKGKSVRDTAAKRGVVTTQKPQKKKKKKEVKPQQPKVQSKPKQTSMTKPKPTSHKTPQTQKPMQKPMQKATATNLSQRYNQFKKSSVAPKITNTSKKNTMLADARKAYQKGKNRTYLGTEQKKTTTKIGKNGKLESVNALTRSEFNRMTEAQRYGKKQGDNLLKGSKRTGQKDIREKVGSKTAQSAYKSKAATGVMQGMSYADVFSNSVGTYNKQAKKAIKKTKESTAYNIGYGAGMAADMAVTGAVGRGAALARSAEKAGAKLAGKAAGKAVEKGAKRFIGKSAKTFAANRAGELAAETPANILDAAKMSMDENGKVNKKEMVKWAAANTALTAGAGGAVEAIGGAATKRLANKTVDLLGKQRAGTITKEESETLGKNLKKLASKSKSAGSNLSGDIANRNIADVKASSKDARIQKAKAKSEGRAERVEAEFAQAKRDRQVRTLAREKERREAKLAAQRHAAGAKASADRSRMAESARLRDKADELRKHLDTVVKQMKSEGTMQGYSRLSAQKEQLEKALAHTQTQIRNVERGTPSGDLREVLRQKKSAGTLEKYGQLTQKEADIRAAVKASTEEAVGETPDNVKKVRKIDAELEKTKRNFENTSDPDEAEMLAQHYDELLNEREKALVTDTEPAKAKDRIAEIDEQITEIHQKQIASKDAEEIRSLNQQAKVLNAEKRDLLAKAKEPKTDAEFDARIAEEEKVLAEMKEQNANPADIERQERTISNLKDRKEGRFAALSGEDAKAELDRVFSGDNLDETTALAEKPKPKIGGEQTAKEVRGEISKTKKMIDSVKRGFFDSFTNLEQIANSIDDVASRDRFRSLIQNVRMSKGMALSKVGDDFIGIYRDSGLAKSGASAKRADFERYCNLKHDLERFDHDTEFLGYQTKEAIEADIARLEGKYKDGSIQKFQERIVKYFDELLDEDVRSGLDTAENIAKLREDYKNYVPTFRDFDGEMNYPTSDAIHFRNFHEAVGGADQRVLSLYEQAIQKTKITMKRGAMNDMFRAVAELNGVKVKDLPKNANPVEALQSSTMTFRDNGKHYVQYWEDGVAKNMEIPEGVYKGLRQWSGEDKAFFMEWKWLNNRAVQKGNELFKAWITDYSLVFGARNFVRDLETGFFYSPNGMRYARNIPRAVCASLADTKPMQMLLKSNVVSDSFKEYVNTYADLAKAYKKNGGEFAQLVKTTNPEKAIRDVFKKKGLLSFIKEVNSTIEMIPRMAEFSAVAEDRAISKLGIKRADWFKMKPSERRVAMNKALADKDAISEAMYRAKEVTLNFDRSGYVGRWLNSGFVPFFNPAVQGLSKLGRVLAKDNKTSSEFASMLAKFAVIGGGSEALFNATIGALDEYQDISDYHKTGALCIPLSIFNKEFGTDFKKTDFLKIPKAREVAALQGPINWTFQHMLYHSAGKDERLFESFKSNAKMWWEQIGPVSPLSDNLFYAPVRIAKGKNWYGGYINSFEDEDFIKAGKSYKAADEETSIVAYGISKSLNSGADKIGNFLGLDKGEINALKQKVWTPKQFDDLLDSYLGIIYDSTIKETSAKNHDLTDAIDAVNNGDIIGGMHSTWSIMRSPFANAFLLDTVFSNRHKQDAYALKTAVNKEMSKLVGQDVGGMSSEEIQESIVKQYGYESSEYKSYLKKQAELKRLNQSFLYVSTNYDEMMSSLYLRNDLSNKQKEYWVRELKKQQNALLDGRQQGSRYANADPMMYAYNAKTKSGKRLFSNDQIIDMCSYESSSGSNNLKDAYTAYRKANPKDKNCKKFFNLTLDAREINRACGDSLSFTSWNVAAYAAMGRKMSSGVDYSAVAKAYGVSDSKLEEAKLYFTVGKGSIKTYTVSHRQVVQGGIDIGKYVGQMESWDIVNSLSSYVTKGGKGRKLLDRAYYAEGYYPLKTMNASRCLFSDKYKDSHWTTEKISTFCLENGFSYKEKDKDGKTIKPDPEKVAAAISKKWGKNRTAEECAAVFEEICPGEPNPFGEIGDYSVKGDTGIQYPSWGRGRRRWHRRGGWHGWGHGGGGGGGGATSAAGATNMGKAKISDVTFASNLDDAYRRKLKKLREASRKNLAKG